MGKTIITFNSVTYALKAKKALSRTGINSKLIKLAGELTAGCTHGVEISSLLFLDAVNTLRGAGIEYSVYHR